MRKLKQYIRKQRRLSMFTFQKDYTVYSNVMLRYAMQALLQNQTLRSCVLFLVMHTLRLNMQVFW
jgi:hypothetical protein